MDLIYNHISEEIMDLQQLVFDSNFRGRFSEFLPEFIRIDRLGGAKCKSCDRAKIRKVIDKISKKIKETPGLFQRLQGLLKESSGKVSPLYTLEHLKKSLLIPEIRKFFGEHCPEDFKLYRDAVRGSGYFADNVGALVQRLHQKYLEDKEILEKFNDLLKNSKISTKITYNSPRKFCKVIQATGSQEIENRINEFCSNHNVHSVSLGADKATILYTLD